MSRETYKIEFGRNVKLGEMLYRSVMQVTKFTDGYGNLTLLSNFQDFSFIRVDCYDKTLSLSSHRASDTLIKFNTLLRLHKEGKL